MSIFDRDRNFLSDVNPDFGRIALDEQALTGNFPVPEPSPTFVLPDKMTEDELTEAEKEANAEMLNLVDETTNPNNFIFGMTKPYIDALQKSGTLTLGKLNTPLVTDFSEDIDNLQTTGDVLTYIPEQDREKPEPTPEPTPAPEPDSDTPAPTPAPDGETPAPAPTPEPTPEPESKRNQVATFLSSDKFLDFLAAVGTGLTTENFKDRGLAKGSVMFTQGEIAKEAKRAEQEFELKKEMIKQMNKGLDPAISKIGIEENKELLTKKSDLEKTLGTMQLFDVLKQILQAEDATSLRAIFKSEVVKPYRVLIGQDEESFDKLSGRDKAKLLANQIEIISAREVLGESGRTISNLDRQLVKELITNLETFSPSGRLNLKSAAELVQSIDLNLGRSRQKVRQLQSEIQSLATNLKQVGADAFITDPNLRKFLEGEGGLEVMYPDLDVDYSALLIPGQEVLQYTADR